MYKIKTEILQICEAFNLGAFKASKTIEISQNGYHKTEFKTTSGTYIHFYLHKKSLKS